MKFFKNIFILVFVLLMTSGICSAQFIDNFDHKNIEGWIFFTGDGNASMDFVQKTDFARIEVDATKDQHNVWWTLIKRDVTEYLDLEKLKNPAFELRVEARVKINIAPRRVNFMINTQRTTNYHKHLMEFDIPDTTGWHTISMTTKDLDAVQGDTLYVQLCVTDFGNDKYFADLDYYRADIINVNEAAPDKGEPLPYHPPIPELKTFSNHLVVSHDALINSNFPDVNFNNWQVTEANGMAKVLTVNANQWAILRWDFEGKKNLKADGPGVLEITTQAVAKGGQYNEPYGKDLGEEFGKVRVIEIFGGEALWDQHNVSYYNFMSGLSYSEVFNTQMIFDVELADKAGIKNYITISRPVMQRLLDGTTKGIMICPLGAVDASFYASEEQYGKMGPKLHFNLAE